MNLKQLLTRRSVTEKERGVVDPLINALGSRFIIWTQLYKETNAAVECTSVLIWQNLKHSAALQQHLPGLQLVCRD